MKLAFFQLSSKDRISISVIRLEMNNGLEGLNPLYTATVVSYNNYVHIIADTGLKSDTVGYTRACFQ